MERDDRHGQATRDTGASTRGDEQAEVARLARVSKRTVERVDAEAEVANFNADAERTRRGIGRPSKAEPFRGFVVGELVTQPDMLAVELLRRAKLKGGKSALYALVKEVRPERARPSVAIRAACASIVACCVSTRRSSRASRSSSLLTHRLDHARSPESIHHAPRRSGLHPVNACVSKYRQPLIRSLLLRRLPRTVVLVSNLVGVTGEQDLQLEKSKSGTGIAGLEFGMNRLTIYPYYGICSTALVGLPIGA